ncbi:glycerate kinase [Halostella sp. JP-L12]|uniref:glycerate kinase type-2 family protein n=1 Tax=Halostella TaxID=1843185 RepID=UPI000EF7E10D|nr:MULTISPECIES: glycerate kinase [Halostella]NHN49352.1 glycerate kinase [Halostella sp. JP-L12]
MTEYTETKVRFERSEDITSEEALALDCLEAGIEAADPNQAVQRAISIEDGSFKVGGNAYDLDRKLIVVGGGNAAGHAASALEDILGEHLDRGAVVTDKSVETDHIETLDGDHPVPSQQGMESTETVLDHAHGATADDIVIAVIAGGGSALMPAPVGKLSIDQLQTVTESLLQSGADIHEINTVRKHLSAVKGGQLARVAAPATIVSLVFSDVVGNDPSVVASGPTAPDDTTFEDALAVLERFDIDPPRTVEQYLRAGSRGDHRETPNADASCFESTSQHIIADGYTAISAAAERAEQNDYRFSILSSRIRGEAREAARSHVAIAEEVISTGHPVEPPVVLISGGETTVTVSGDGTGGPNQEFALSAGIEIDDIDITVASVDTDGLDGSTDVAGAIVNCDTVDDTSSAKQALRRNDAYPYLENAGALLSCGPTGTNVNDLRVVIVQ